MKPKRLSALILAFALVLTLCPARASAESGMDNFSASKRYDGRFTDISGWAESYIITAYESGLMNGVSDTEFAPNDTLTGADTVTLAARIHSIYNTGGTILATAKPGDAWYKPYYDYCLSSGLFTSEEVPYGTLTAAAPRRLVVRIFARALPESELNAMNTVENGAIPDVPANDADAAAIYRFYRAGVLTGDSDGNLFHPETYILRSEISAIVTRLTKLSPRSEVKLTLDELYSDRPDAVYFAGELYYVGMPFEGIVANIGSPQELLPSVNEFYWYCWYDEDYSSVLLLGAQNNTVEAVCAAGKGFTYLGASAGDRSPLESDPHNLAPLYGGRYISENRSYVVLPLTDSLAGDTLHGVYLRNYRHYSAEGASDAESIAGESKVSFLLTNVFRRLNGVEALKWDDLAASAAKSYAAEMASSGRFDHIGADGSNPGTRLNAAGVSWSACGENISAGQDDGVLVFSGFVNSETHRANMLSPDFGFMGVGGAASNDIYDYYWTQNYFG